LFPTSDITKPGIGQEPYGGLVFGVGDPSFLLEIFGHMMHEDAVKHRDILPEVSVDPTAMAEGLEEGLLSASNQKREEGYFKEADEEAINASQSETAVGKEEKQEHIGCKAGP